MSRMLQSEKRFFVLVGNVPITSCIEGIIASYKIMGAQIEYSSVVPAISSEDFGTLCHIDTADVIQRTITTIKDIRYIGYINGTENILALSCTGYIGIPIKTDAVVVPDGMWEVSYPHITLAPPMGANKFDQFKGLMGFPIEYSISEIIKTKSTYSHSALINVEEHHVTRIVLDGQKPFIAKKEMTGIRGLEYNTRIGYPVIM